MLLAPPRGRHFLPGSAAEWGGLYVFAVGVYGATFRPLTRHLLLWNHVPLDWFYLALMLIGSAFMLGSTLAADAEAERLNGPRTGWGRFFAGVRLGITLALLAALIWWAIAR